jgi:hypothetical protein
LGAPGPELVSAVCYSFSPRFVAQYIPAAWHVVGSVEMLRARSRAVDRMYRALLGDRIAGPELTEAAAIARAAAEAANTAGRPLAAANAELPWPDEPHVALWQAITILREQRGDGHVAALLTAGLDPCEALVSFAAIGAAAAETFASRGWTGEEWDAARERLTARGWLDADGQATDRCREGRDAIERCTDELAADPWRSIGADQAERLAELSMPLLVAVLESGMLPSESTLGIGKIPAPK